MFLNVYYTCYIIHRRRHNSITIVHTYIPNKTSITGYPLLHRVICIQHVIPLTLIINTMCSVSICGQSIVWDTERLNDSSSGRHLSYILQLVVLIFQKDHLYYWFTYTKWFTVMSVWTAHMSRFGIGLKMTRYTCKDVQWDPDWTCNKTEKSPWEDFYRFFLLLGLWQD